MPRHIVLLTRDTSLAIALKALLGEHDRVSELESPKGWRTLNGSPVDAVVIDLPPALRKAAVEALERSFTGRLVVLLDPGEDLAKTADRQRCAVLHRPFGMSELWTLVVASGPQASPTTPPEPPQVGERPDAPPRVGERPDAPPQVGERPDAKVRPPVEPPGRGGWEPATAPPDRQAAVTPEPAWRWRFRRFQHAPKPPQAGELTQPMPTVEVDSNGETPGAAAVEAAPASPAAPDTTGASNSAAIPGAAAAAGAAAVPGAAGVPGTEETSEGARVSGTAMAATRDDKRATSLMDTAMWNEANQAPQAVATRLARRLRLDVATLLLDNGRGLLETAGGVGLAPAERRVQVEYGHDVLRELFRVGVGLIDDTERVRSILGGIPFGEADTLMMVPLVHEGHGFGVLLAGRHRSGRPDSEFTELEIEALMDFAEDVAPALRSAILLRRLKGQLNLAEGR